MNSRADSFISLVIPAYNEESRLLAPIPGVIAFLEKTYPRWEIIFSDDGSTDSTPALIRKLQAEHPSIRSVGAGKNCGKGSAVRLGLSAAAGNLILFSDADFSSPIEECMKLHSALEEGYDIAIGSRGLLESQIEVRQSWARETMGKTFNLILRTLLPIPFNDTQCGFKMFRREAAAVLLPRLRVNRFAFDVEMLVIAQQHLLRVSEVPVVWRNVLESKVHPVKSSLEMLRDVFAIRYRLAMSLYA